MRIRSHELLIRSLELDNLFSRIAIRFLDFNIRQFEGSIAIQQNEFSKSRERFTTRENSLFYSRERINNPWEGMAQIDLTI